MKIISDLVLFLISAIIYAVIGTLVLLMLPKAWRRQVTIIGVRILRFVSPMAERLFSAVKSRSEDMLKDAQAAARMERSKGASRIKIVKKAV